MMAERHEGLRVETLGFHFDEPTKAFAKRVAALERRAVSTANLRGTAWRLRQVLHTEIRGLETLHLSKAAESPLRFAFGCFPPASPAIAAEAGKHKARNGSPLGQLILLKKIGAGEGIRTLDPDLGKVVLYP